MSESREGIDGLMDFNGLFRCSNGTVSAATWILDSAAGTVVAGPDLAAGPRSHLFCGKALRSDGADARIISPPDSRC